MIKTCKYLFVCLLLSAYSGYSDEFFELTINRNADGFTTAMKPKEGLDAGNLKVSEVKTFKIILKNQIDKQIKIKEWNYQEDCFKFESLPDSIKAKEKEELSLTIDTEGLSGKFNRNIICQIESDGETRDIYLPVKFNVPEEGMKLLENDDTITGNGGNSAETEFQIEFKDYKEGGLKKYPEAKAWIFAAKNCPGCNYLEKMLLPRLFERELYKEKPVVVFVDLDKTENFIFLMEVEKTLKSKGEKTPILYWKDKLYYGNDTVGKLIEKGDD